MQQVLRLFRDWSLKLLKEKAKVSVAKGCYLMGVVDETGTLKGHQDVMYDQDDSDIDRMDLPEIFVSCAMSSSYVTYQARYKSMIPMIQLERRSLRRFV